MHRTIRLILLISLMFASLSEASQIVLTTGYANSRKPESGSEVHTSRYFDAGGGYAFGTRIDIATPNVWFGPAFFFWNNVTGGTYSNYNSNYFQIELGGRLSYRTHTIPAFYTGIGLGYTLARGEIRSRFVELAGNQDFDGEFPTASVHIGLKGPTRTHGIGVLAEAAFHFGLDSPTGRAAIGPAKAWTIQIGVAFDTKFAGE